MTDLIFIQKNSEVVAVGTGAFEKRSKPDATRPSFYVNDFFLEDYAPWVVPAEFHELSVVEFKEKFSAGSASSAENISWQTPDDGKFRKFFQKIRSAIEQGILEKIVPVQFEYGTLPDAWRHCVIETLAMRFASYLSSGLYLFGYQRGHHGFCGLTPELVFEKLENHVVTAALAGTAAARFGDRSIRNPKDFREHQLVVDDIGQVLRQFGLVTIGETSPYWNGSLIHLRAKLEVQCTTAPEFSELVAAIHPTAALGVYPRNSNSLAILKSSDTKMRREFYAAPFGIRYPNGDGLCIAAIRSVFWQGQEVRLGAGCGVIEESDPELELQELALKRKSIREKLIIRE